jgi:two-component system cell cycle sensor histidine kinase PleC
MARSHATSAFTRAATIEGIARPFARPAYVQLLRSEAWLQRLVPLMVGVFLASIWIGVTVQMLNARNEVLTAAAVDVELVALAAVSELRNAPQTIDTRDKDAMGASLQRALPGRSLADGRILWVTDERGRLIAGSPYRPIGGTLIDLLGPHQPLTTLAERAGVMRIDTPGHGTVLGAVRMVGMAGVGQVAVVQPLDKALAAWWRRAGSVALLAATTSAVIATLGIAFFQQSARAREADFICAQVRMRVDLALSRGRSGLWDWDIARGRIYWSDSMYALLGRARLGEFLSVGDLTALIHPEDADLLEAANRIALTDVPAIDHVFRIRHADGSWIWIRARGAVVRHHGADEPHFVGIAIDITEQKRMAAETATADARLRDAIESLSEAFVLWDSDNRLVVCNTRYQKLHALPNDAVRPGIAYPDLHARGTAPVIVSEAASGPVQDGARNTEILLGDGRWIMVSERRTRDGGHVSVGTDITAHKRYEQSLQDKQAALESTVHDLTQSRLALQNQAQQLKRLADDYLLQKSEAESANRAKTEFLANMGHELKTPLNAIIGFAEMLEHEIYGKLGHTRYREYAQDIRMSGEHLASVISDVLDMSQIEAGRRALTREPIGLCGLVIELVADHQAAAAAKGIRLSQDCRGMPAILGDRKALTQTLGNLLKNAIKFTPDGGAITVRVRRQGDYLNVFVADTGIGIAPAQIARITRPFEQVGSVLANGNKGSGLGLPIANSLVTLHGGVLRLRSRVGVGTIVMIQLPAEKDATTALLDRIQKGGAFSLPLATARSA